jgi:ribonuclease PH
MQNCYFPAATATAAPDEARAALLAQGRRLDGTRSSSDELRSAFMRLGVVSGAAGSAYVEAGRTRVVCAVYGPRNDTRARREFSNEGQLVCDFKFAPFADPEGRRERGQVRPRSSIGGC